MHLCRPRALFRAVFYFRKILTSTIDDAQLHGRMLRYLDKVVRSRLSAKRQPAHVAACAGNRQIVSLKEELETSIFERMPGGLRAYRHWPPDRFRFEVTMEQNAAGDLILESGP